MKKSITEKAKPDSTTNKQKFTEFLKKVRDLDLSEEGMSAAAHHSNGCGRDWEALRKIDKKKN